MINDKKEYFYKEEIYKFIGSESAPIGHVMAGTTYPDANYEIIRQMSNAYSIEYVYEGEGVIQHDNQIYKITAGDFFILHSNKYHHYFASPKKPWKKIWILLLDGCPYIKHLIDDYKLSGTVIVPNYNKPEILEKCLDEVKANNITTGRKLEFLLHYLIADVSDFERHSKNKSLTTAEKLKDFLDRNLHNRLLIKNCCDFMCMGKSQMLKIFRKAYGISPMEYHRNEKIRDSQTLLIHTDLSVSEIAAKYSFNNVYHYSKIFKSVVGISPSEYRKINKKII